MLYIAGHAIVIVKLTISKSFIQELCIVSVAKVQRQTDRQTDREGEEAEEMLDQR